MISGANEEQLELSNARANIVMKLDNTSTYESWLIIDTYIDKLEKENQELKLELSGYRQAILNDKEMLGLKEENQELKKQLEEYKYSHSCSFVDTCKNVTIANYNQQKEFISYLENEKDRLARQCSQIYEDSLGKTRLVNEDIFNEVDTILSKYREIIGDNK